MGGLNGSRVSRPYDVMSYVKATRHSKEHWCHLREAYLGSLLTTQVSALSDLLKITTVVLFTPPVP